MKSTKFVVPAIFCLLATQAAAASFLGPQGSFSTFLGKLEWSGGSRCYKPTKPYSRDRYAWESYKQGVLRYADCLKDAADNDAKYAVEVVSDGYEKELEKLKSELQSAY